MDFNSTCLSNCSPLQIISLSNGIDDITKISIYNQQEQLYCDCGDIKYSYSTDGICWSCYSCKEDIESITSGLDSDFFIKIKMRGGIGNVKYYGEDTPYTTSLDGGFDFSFSCQNSTQQTLYNPYANLEGAVSLQQYLSNLVSCIVGIPVYYFKVDGEKGSKDITFKEYCLTHIVQWKQIKLIINDGQMPSSKPEFNDWGIDFSTDWETEINKQDFSTAFGQTSKPMEGDIIWIPLMKRMWMVNSSYEEKKDGLMWQNTTFKVGLVKYQQKESLDLGESEEIVQSLVVQTYDDFFSTKENQESGEVTQESPKYSPSTLYNVFESDSLRKQATTEHISFFQDQIHQKSTKLSELQYEFIDNTCVITYQKMYCGDEGSLSFIFRPTYIGDVSQQMINVGDIKIICDITQKGNVSLTLFNHQESKLEGMNINNNYFVYLRWSKKLNIIEFVCHKYVFPTDIPQYKLQHFHYYFEMNEPVSQKVSKYDIEMTQEEKREIRIQGVKGMFTNFKLFDNYNSNIGELLQQYPTNQHLLINDTSRRFVELNGVKL